MTRHSKKLPYLCPECFKVFYIENKTEYKHKYCKKCFCSNNCLTKYKKRTFYERKILGKWEVENDGK